MSNSYFSITHQNCVGSHISNHEGMVEVYGPLVILDGFTTGVPQCNAELKVSPMVGYHSILDFEM